MVEKTTKKRTKKVKGNLGSNKSLSLKRVKGKNGGISKSSVKSRKSSNVRNGLEKNDVKHVDSKMLKVDADVGKPNQSSSTGVVHEVSDGSSSVRTGMLSKLFGKFSDKHKSHGGKSVLGGAHSLAEKPSKKQVNSSKEKKGKSKVLEKKEHKNTAKNSLSTKKKKPKEKIRNKQLLRKYLDKAGYEDTNEDSFTKNIFRVVIGICFLFSFVGISIAAIGKPGVGQSLLFLMGIWTGVFAAIFVLAWVVIYIFLDLKIFNRTLQIEEVLPDFLQLTSANISAGMPIDRALWFAVRPRFGILAKEIEEVAKATITGEDLSKALLDFSKKYDSTMLKRSVSLLIEGMQSGGEIAELLNKISLNIQETKILKKEMSANVMTYVIFIGFATAVAAPILFALAGQLLIIIKSLIGLLAFDPSSAGSGSFTLSLSSDAVSIADFRIFSLVTLFISALFSSFIISVIRKGSIKEGIRFVPMIILATLVLYFIASWILGLLLGGIVDL